MRNGLHSGKGCVEWAKACIAYFGNFWNGNAVFEMRAAIELSLADNESMMQMLRTWQSFPNTIERLRQGKDFCIRCSRGSGYPNRSHYLQAIRDPSQDLDLSARETPR